MTAQSLDELPRDARAIRLRVVEALASLDLGDAAGALGMKTGPDGDSIEVGWSHSHGDARVDEVVARCYQPALARHAFRLIDFRSAPRAQRRRFHTIEELLDWDVVQRSATWRTIFAPSDVIDQSRLLVEHGGTVLSYVFFLWFRGAPRFQPSDRRLQRLVPSVRRALVAAKGATRNPEEAADFVVHPTGTIEFASDPGRAWIAVRGFADELAALVRHEDSPRRHERLAPVGPCADADVVISRVGGREGVRYVVRVAPPRPIRLAPLAVLSASQREVAQLAANGATLKEIGALTNRSAETVRSHLRAAYDRLGVSSRAELGRVMAEPPPSTW